MFRRSKAAVVITFVVPIALIYLFGHVFGLYGSNGGPSGIPVAVVNASDSPAALELISALKAEKSLRIITEMSLPDGTSRPLTEADVRAALHDNAYRFALLLPTDLITPDRLGLRLKFLSNPRNEIEAQTVNGLLQKTIFSHVPQLIGQSLQANARGFLGEENFHRFNQTIAGAVSTAFGGDAAAIQQDLEAGHLVPRPARDATAPAPATAGPDFLARMINLETEQVAGREVKNPMAARIVGGYAIMFLLFAVSGSATSFFEERSSGIFQRLLASPVRPAHILWARFLFGVILGLVQIFALFLAGRVFFGLDIFGHAGSLFAVSLAAAAACSAFGMLVTAVSPSAEAARGIATFVVISMSALGGAWFPVSFMPEHIQLISKLTLVYWSVEGFTDVLWAGRSFIEVLPKIGVLTAMAAGVMAVTVWRFNRRKFLE